MPVAFLSLCVELIIFMLLLLRHNLCFQTFSLAGLGAGVTESILVNPFEVVKVTQQSNRNKMKEAPSTWTVTKEIVKNDVSVLVLNWNR